MATDAGVSVSDSAIVSRLAFPEDRNLSVEAARGLLGIRFDPGDLERLKSLLATNRDDRLTPDEQAELDNYRRIGLLLDLMHSRARRVLQRHESRSSPG